MPLTICPRSEVLSSSVTIQQKAAGSRALHYFTHVAKILQQAGVPLCTASTHVPSIPLWYQWLDIMLNAEDIGMLESQGLALDVPARKDYLLSSFCRAHSLLFFRSQSDFTCLCPLREDAGWRMTYYVLIYLLSLYRMVQHDGP